MSPELLQPVYEALETTNTSLVYLAVVAIAIMLLTLYIGARLFHAIGKVRSNARRAAETSRRVQQEWEDFNKNQSEAIRRKLGEIEERAASLEQRAESLAQDANRRIEDFEGQISATSQEVQRLEHYLRDVFEVELKNVFDSFDTTVSDVLDQMKDDLMRGVNRIEQIQSVMAGRETTEGRLEGSRETISRLAAGEPEEDTRADVASEEHEESPAGETQPIGPEDQEAEEERPTGFA